MASLQGAEATPIIARLFAIEKLRGRLFKRGSSGVVRIGRKIAG